MQSNEEQIPLPPADLVARVTGSEDLDWFRHSGGLSLNDWERSLGGIARSLDQFSQIVDYGCGCGRVLRHLRPRLRPDQTIHAMDVDAEAINWVRQNIDGVEAHVLSPLPPTPVDGASIDLVLNHSVFTHLTEEVQYLWLDEIARILRQNGLAVLTFHGRNVWESYRAHLVEVGRTDEEAHINRRLERYGFHYIGGRTTYEDVLPEYYGSSFQTIDYVEREWQRHFTIKAWYTKAALAHQDIVVLERK